MRTTRALGTGVLAAGVMLAPTSTGAAWAADPPTVTASGMEPSPIDA